MRKWSNNSKKVFDELTPELQWLVATLRDEVCDLSLVCGFRNEADQNAAFDSGNSKVRFPDGKHNKFPSDAVDLQPYPFAGTKEKRWAALGYIAGRAIELGRSRGLVIRWGGDWDRDGDLTDQDFDDLFHLEIVR